MKRVNTLDYEEGSDKVLFLFKHIKTEHFKLSISGFMANSVLCSSVGGVLYLTVTVILGAICLELKQSTVSWS